jgi:predicted ATPase/DNA-binding winged helix-turn-helix (wHTH) protein
MSIWNTFTQSEGVTGVALLAAETLRLCTRESPQGGDLAKTAGVKSQNLRCPIQASDPPGPPAISGEPCLLFGSFRLTPGKRLLEKDGFPVGVGSRALDILIALVDRAGDLVTKRELIAYVWPGLSITESCLRVHITGLRRVLGDGEGGDRYVSNVPGRGYVFVAPVTRSPDHTAFAPPPAEELGEQRWLPALLERMAGRDETVRDIKALLMSRRFLTIVGAGGIGKTTVAVSVAHALLAEFQAAVYFVDLGSFSDPDLVLTTVASTVGLALQTRTAISSVGAFLKDKSVLLVLDNCEHLIDAVARLAETVYSQAPRVHILATSREALRAEGERVYRLAPLHTPIAYGGLNAMEIQAFPAVQLFIERASAAGGPAELTEAEAPVVAAICKRLDGIALAIELAAGFVGEFGIGGTAGLLDNRFRLLRQQGRRTAPPRQRTLNALVDWSYNLLTSFQQLTLRRLSIFAGAFTLEAAEAVIAEDATELASANDALIDLVRKSLVSTIDADGVQLFRLLETTRAYGLEQLVQNGEKYMVARRHALYFASLLERDNARRTTCPLHDDVLASAWRLGNVRSALEWSFSESCDFECAVALVARAAPSLLNLSLLVECGVTTRCARKAGMVQRVQVPSG